MGHSPNANRPLLRYTVLNSDALATALFPNLVVSGGWSRAFDAICVTLEQRLSAERAVIIGARHSVQFIGGPFNQRLLPFLRAARE